MIADKIKLLRERSSLTQSDLAKKLGITRSSVNAWEMGISTPSTQYLMELALLFKVSTDYLLGMQSSSTISVEGLSEKEITSIVEIISCYKEGKKIK